MDADNTSADFTFLRNSPKLFSHLGYLRDSSLLPTAEHMGP